MTDGLDSSEIRADLVARIRREIAAGTYDTPEKFALALDRLLSDLED
jgi:negative regulator of flagellin synthesis FlgM